MSLSDNLFQFIFMKLHTELQKAHKSQCYFTYIFLFYLDILILKNLFQSVFLIKNLKIVGVIIDDVVAGLCCPYIDNLYGN